MCQFIDHGLARPVSVHNGQSPRWPGALGRSGRLLGLVVTLISACVSTGDPVHTTQQKQLSNNQLIAEDVFDNLTALRQAGEQALASGIAAMAATESGRNLARYAVICALDPDDSVSVDHDGMVYEFHGRLGLAPGWRQQALDGDARQRLSGCILAHVNAFGVEVPISVRLGNNSDTEQGEVPRYKRHEGAFYGDLFAPTPTVYACIGEPVSDLDVPYGTHDLTLGDRLLRRCTDEALAGSGQTMCGFTFAGACSDVCDQVSASNYASCWSSPDRTDGVFAEATNVWTLAHDDPNSVWPVLYQQVYGTTPE